MLQRCPSVRPCYLLSHVMHHSSCDLLRQYKMAYPELYFNIDTGYLEGICRGFRGGILTRADYINLVQCETLEGALLVLNETVKLHLCRTW